MEHAIAAAASWMYKLILEWIEYLTSCRTSSRKNCLLSFSVVNSRSRMHDAYSA